MPTFSNQEKEAAYSAKIERWRSTHPDEVEQVRIMLSRALLYFYEREKTNDKHLDRWEAAQDSALHVLDLIIGYVVELEKEPAHSSEETAETKHRPPTLEAERMDVFLERILLILMNMRAKNPDVFQEELRGKDWQVFTYLYQVLRDYYKSKVFLELEKSGQTTQKRLVRFKAYSF